MKQLPPGLFQKYLSGQCSPEEEALIAEWYTSAEPEAEFTGSLSEFDKQQLKSSIKQRITFKVNESSRPGRKTVLRNMGWVTTGVAAAMLIFWGVLRHQKEPSVTAPVLANMLLSLTNTTAAITDNKLSDGSHVWMMPGAELTYHKYFAGDKREVKLYGEAFFEVTKNPARPFIIYSKNLITKVWGTSFRVRDSKELSFADVTVLTGKVSVKLLNSNGVSRPEVMIYPSQQVTYLKKQQVFAEQPKANMATMSIWKKPDIRFNNRPLREVIPVLSQAFQLKITAHDEKIKDLLLTADLNGLNFVEIMKMLHGALDIEYSINGQNVIFKTNTNQ